MPARLLKRLAARGLTIERVERMSRTHAGAAFRLELEQGVVVRLRLLPSEAEARRLWRLLGAGHASVLARRVLLEGRAVVTEFVEGTPLDRDLPRARSHRRDAFIRATGRLLASLHRRRLPRAIKRRTPAGYQRLFTEFVRDLGRRKHLARTHVVRLTRLHLTSVRYALNHGDVCPENLILTPAGTLRLIDEERLAVRPVAFDLARVVTRWPLEARGERLLVEAYRRAGGRPHSFSRDRAFWIALALAASAHYRLRSGLPGARGILRQLRVVIDDHQEVP